jgi:Ca2+-binding RTX toxin-like protein
MVSLFAAVAYAATIEGTSEGETLQESNKNDTIFGRQGNDTILAQRFTPDTDVAKGNLDNDIINVKDGDVSDTAAGGDGTDTCYTDVGATAATSDQVSSCEVLNPATPPPPN